MATEKIRAYYVASTHWDREWYEPFQGFRYQLVRLMDELLDTMERDPRFRCFQTDGQSIILEDYLEIRPERAAQVRRFTSEGRLRVGPWYTMPDENLVSGESFVRNLEEGLRVAADYGNMSRVGFVCDMFGHVSQVPQLFREFGFDCAFIFRGVNDVTHGGAFRWRGADGTELATYRFGPREGYFDYGANIRKAFKHDVPFDLDTAAQELVAYTAMQRDRTGLDLALLFDGGDHMPIEPQTGDLLAKVRALAPHIDLQHTGLEEFATALAARSADLPQVFEGELRNAGLELTDGNWVIPGVLSSRVRLKQDNRARETELCAWVEPFSHMAERLAGYAYPHSFIRRAWRYVLENHAHDSICGCSPDQIHKDMEFRFDQARLINDNVLRHALDAVATRVDLPDQEGEQFALLVCNPTQAEINGPVDLELWFDEKTPSRFMEFFGYEAKVGFRLYDAEGVELPFDYLTYRPQRRRFYRAWRRIPIGQECIVVTVAVPLKIPAFGYTTLTCKPVAAPTRHPVGTLIRGDRMLENEHLRVTAGACGVLALYDKRTGQTYDRLLVFEERADIGDGWYHGVAVNDQIISSTGAHAEVAVVEQGALKATLRITNRMRVPARFEFDTKMRRSPETRELVIETDVTLRAGADYIELRTVIDNQVRDHRIRVLFESGAQTDTYLADSPFDVVERAIALPADNHVYRELATETRPQQSWTAVHDRQRGLAIVAPGLFETGVRDEPQRTLALTLLRGFRRAIFTDCEETGAQSYGPHEFRYRLVPLAGAPDRTALAIHAQRVAGGLRTSQVLGKQQPPAAERTLPRTHGELMLMPGKLIVTSFRRRPETDQLELRLSNVAAETVTEEVRLAERPVAAIRTRLDGQEVEALPIGVSGEVRVTVGPRKIATVLLTLPPRVAKESSP